MKAGEELPRWHWVWTGTVFRLDQRGRTAGGRPVQEVAYLRKHQPRWDYRRAQLNNEPLGNGAVDATCVPYQCRFTRTGQF